MPRPTSSDCMCCPRVVMACHARRFRPCVMSKGGDVMPRPMLPTVCAVLGRLCCATPDAVRLCVFSTSGDVMPRPTLFDRECCPKEMMPCHARRLSTMYAVQGR